MRLAVVRKLAKGRYTLALSGTVHGRRLTARQTVTLRK
jgi:hypothetical protein